MPFNPLRSYTATQFNRCCLRLAAYRAGRILLHLATLAYSRKNLRWHLDGVCRELPFKPSTAR